MTSRRDFLRGCLAGGAAAASAVLPETACARDTRDRRGTNQRSETMYSVTQARKGPMIHRSMRPSTATMVTK